MGKVLRRDKQEDRHSDEDRYIYQENARREDTRIVNKKNGCTYVYVIILMLCKKYSKILKYIHS